MDGFNWATVVTLAGTALPGIVGMIIAGINFYRSTPSHRDTVVKRQKDEFDRQAEAQRVTHQTFSDTWNESYGRLEADCAKCLQRVERLSFRVETLFDALTAIVENPTGIEEIAKAKAVLRIARRPV